MAIGKMVTGDTRLIIEECRLQGLLRNQAAYVLATAWHETARTMEPVRETLAKTDAKAKELLSKAFKAGKLASVKSDYWSGGYFGRGFVQLTHKANYERAGKELGVDLVRNPSRAMEPAIAAAILVRGMKGGWFTGKKLADYITLRKSDYVAARRIVNGTDRAAMIAGYAKEYDAALMADGYGAEPAVVEVPVVVEKPVMADPGELEKSPAKSKTVWTWAFTGIATAATAIANALGDLDWRVQMFVAAVIVAFAVYGIKRRVDLFNAVKSLRSELDA